MFAKRVAPLILGLALTGSIAGGCTSGSNPTEVAGSSQSRLPSPTPDDRQTDPAASPPGSPVPDSQVPSSDASATGFLAPEPTLEPPPGASLAVEGGDPVDGEQGSWSWRGAASDAPWLPGFPIHVGANERLTFNLRGAVPIDTWQAARVPPSAVPGGDGAIGMAEGAGPTVAFNAPPKGRWSLAVTVRFGDNLGDATYYWAVSVD